MVFLVRFNAGITSIHKMNCKGSGRLIALTHQLPFDKPGLICIHYFNDIHLLIFTNFLRHLLSN